MTDFSVSNITVYDCEVYPGWFEVGFQLPTGEVYQYAATPDSAVAIAGRIEQALRWIRDQGYTLAGFNSSRYDDLVLTEFLREKHPDAAYRLSIRIIVNGEPTWRMDNNINAVDLMPILPATQRLSLKKVGVCLGHSRLQELPVDYNKVPDQREQAILLDYNTNDLEITAKLADYLRPDLELRAEMSEQYGIDLRSKGEAALAETILLHEYHARGGHLTKQELNELTCKTLGDSVQVKPPTWWGKLDAPRVRTLGDEIFATPILLDDNQRMTSDAIKRVVYLNDRYYQMGVGGLHSIDGPGCWMPKDDEALLDIDVVSYYPNIILTQSLAPRSWGDLFARIYASLVQRRMEAKRSGDASTAQILKIAANGTFGKSSDIFSSLFDPEMTAHVTVLGQLGLLTLIETLEGVAVICSANTDGVTVLVKRSALETLRAKVAAWEAATGLEMEYTEYRALYQKDVNNYVALKTDGKVKQKGRFSDKWPNLRGMPNANIVATAITNLIRDRKPIRDTIAECQDINQFILTLNVSAGWATWWNERPLGRVLRFYKSNHVAAAPIFRTLVDDDVKGLAWRVSQSESCVPLEDLPTELPADLDTDWYVREAMKLWRDISIPKRPGLNRWAEVASAAGLPVCAVNPSAKSRSLASSTYGDYDFSSLPRTHVLGVKTGSGILAKVTPEGTELYRVAKDYPSKTRALVERDHGFELVYGARVPAPVPYTVTPTVEDFDPWYTPGELKKVKR